MRERADEEEVKLRALLKSLTRGKTFLRVILQGKGM